MRNERLIEKVLSSQHNGIITLRCKAALCEQAAIRSEQYFWAVHAASLQQKAKEMSSALS